MMRLRPRGTRVAVLASVLASTACGALLGIEDVQKAPPPGAEVGESGASGDTNSNGGMAVGDAGTAASGSPNGGASHGGSSHGGSSHGGESFAGASTGGSGNPNGGASGGVAGAAAGSSGSSGTGGAQQEGSSVTGHVIDSRGHQLSGVTVEIAGKLAMTDSGGAFTFSDVPNVYDASLVVQYSTQTQGYVYQGLKRRDPTLQVYQGLSEQTQVLNGTFTGTDQSATGLRSISLALAGHDGEFELRDAPKTTFSRTIKWLGPANTQEQAHALVWQYDSAGLPVGYYAYATAPVMLSGTATAPLAFSMSLPATTIASSLITGTVTPAGFSDRVDSVSLRFSSGATMRLVSLAGAGNTFSYLVPSLADAGVTFAAIEGCYPSAIGCGIVHKDGLVGGGAPITVHIPSPVTNLTLLPATAVDQNTQFSLTPPTGSSGPFVSMLINGTNGNDRLYVITSEPSFKLPSVANGAYSLVHGDSYRWQVETHGTGSTVDEMAGPSGFIDAFSSNHSDYSPLGTRPGDGTYTLSAPKFFTAN